MANHMLRLGHMTSYDFVHLPPHYGVLNGVCEGVAKMEAASNIGWRDA